MSKKYFYAMGQSDASRKLPRNKNARIGSTAWELHAVKSYLEGYVNNKDIVEKPIKNTPKLMFAIKNKQDGTSSLGGIIANFDTTSNREVLAHLRKSGNLHKGKVRVKESYIAEYTKYVIDPVTGYEVHW